MLETLQTSTERKYATFGSKGADTLTDSLSPTLLNTKGAKDDIELVDTTIRNPPRLQEIWPGPPKQNHMQMNAVLPLTESEEYLIQLKRGVNDGLPLSMIKP